MSVCTFFGHRECYNLDREALRRAIAELIRQADVCLCYVNHTWGGAYKFASMARHCGLKVINLGDARI